ncbi:MAG: carboxypeptidase-like regulatory domain-containing protein [Spirochaetales bacterium]|nr:carboxypeptidase-like regulatory domain-containing protein [Spirochaetales bacterium]
MNIKTGFIIFFVLIYPLFSISAISLDGILLDEGDKAVPNSTIVLLELDLITITDADGSFSFEDVADAEYTLLVIAPGFKEMEFKVNISAEPQILRLSPEIIEMDTIVVKADTEGASDLINEGVTSEELERLPARADPFEAVALESGILKTLDVMNFNIGSGERGDSGGGFGPVIIPEGRISIGGSNEVSVYGGESDWNNYYYDYIRLPTNTHTFGYPEADAVVPREVIDSIDIYRGAYPVEYGPGIGGLFTMNPGAPAESWEVSFTPSIMDISAVSSIQITEDIGMMISMNQSILNYTVLPLITALSTIDTEEELVEGEIPTSISYGDAMLSFSFTPPGHDISVDFLGYYDSWAFDLGFENATLNSIYGPYFIAGGAQWISSISADFGNTLYVFGSLYKDTGNFDFYLPSASSGWITDYKLHWTSTVNSLQAGEEIQWNPLPDISLLAGINGRISDLSGIYSDDNLVVDGDETTLSDYEHEILFTDLFFSTYAYVKIIGDWEDAGYKLGAGLLLYPETGTLRPAVEGELVFKSETASFALAAGWSPGIIDEFTYIDRRLDELYYELETETSAYQPPMAASAAGQAAFVFDDQSSLKLSPYFSWYYDLSGISMSTSYTDLDDTFVSLDPAYGYSTGIDFGWSSSIGENFNWDLSYGFSMTRYYTEELGWVVPNTEVQHALKGSGLFKAGGFKAGLSLFVYSGLPFTPQVVEEDLLGAAVRQGDYNSAIEYIPSYELSTNISYEWDFETFKLAVFFNSSNLVDGLNIINSGLRDELETVIGSTTADFSSRNYEFSYTIEEFLITMLTSEIGLSFSF